MRYATCGLQSCGAVCKALLSGDRWVTAPQKCDLHLPRELHAASVNIRKHP